MLSVIANFVNDSEKLTSFSMCVFGIDLIFLRILVCKIFAKISFKQSINI